MFRRLLWRSLSARRARVALGLAAVTLGVGIATTLAALALRVGDDVARALRAAGPNFLIRPQGAAWGPDLGGTEVTAGRAGLGLPESAVTALKETFWKHNILHAAPEISVAARLDGAEAALTGTWFEHPVPTEDGPWLTGLRGLRPHWRVEGRWPAEDVGEVALGRRLASRLGARPGQALKVEVGGVSERWTVTGVVEAGGAEDGHAWTGLARAQRLAARPGVVDRIWLSALLRPASRTPPPDPARDPRGYERYMCTAYPSVVAADLSSQLPEAEVLPATEQIAGEAHVVTRLTLLMALLALAALTAATLGLFSTTTATVVERQGELALLRAIGASRHQLAALLLGETLVTSAAGGLLGWGLGSLGALALQGEGAGGAGAFHPLLLPVALTLALGLGIAGTLGPLRLALGLDPAKVLRA